MSLGNILTIIIIVTFIAIILFTTNYTGNAKIQLGNKTIEAEIADSNYEKMKGLMNHDSLKEDEGLLFINSVPRRSGIWMMNMSFPIDIMWINTENEIIHIVKGAQPCKIDCEVFKPEEKAKYVLEVNSGFTEKNNIKVGDSVKIELTNN